MLDVGRRGPEPVEPSQSLNGLKSALPNPAAYFLGENFEGVVLPTLDAEYYGIPPHKQYIFEGVSDDSVSLSGFAPLLTHARGGLAEAWTAGCYPFNDADLAAFPFGYERLGPHYGEVARRIGITGEDDDLARFYPIHDHLMPPLTLDRHSELLIETYRRKRTAMNQKLGCYVGRTRVATLSEDRHDRRRCQYLGRCLWGCPIGALYTPSITLRECLQHEAFTYVSGHRVKHFRTDASGRITSLVAAPVPGGPDAEFPVDRLVLAAGTLASARIMLESVRIRSGETPRLWGLMDNRQALMPFVNLRMIGSPFTDESYQYHLLGLGIEAPDPGGYIHGQITTLKTALMHPIIQKLPFDLRTSARIGRLAHAALGVVNVNLSDSRRADSYVTLSPNKTGETALRVVYTPRTDEPDLIRYALRAVRTALRHLGCVVPPGMTHIRPMGASVHYGGTLPMSATDGPWTTTDMCQSRDFHNLFLVDGSTFPALPAKNFTFTLMANAVRVAAEAF